MGSGGHPSKALIGLCSGQTMRLQAPSAGRTLPGKAGAALPGSGIQSAESCRSYFFRCQENGGTASTVIRSGELSSSR